MKKDKQGPAPWEDDEAGDAPQRAGNRIREKAGTGNEEEENEEMGLAALKMAEKKAAAKRERNKTSEDTARRGKEERGKEEKTARGAGNAGRKRGNDPDDTADLDEEAEEEIQEAAKEAVKGARKAGKRGRWAPRISYRWIMGNVGFFLFLAALAVIYIYNGHYADKVVRDISRTNKELKELQYEYKTLRSEVMFRSKQSELAKAVEPFGLKELLQPPMMLTDSTVVAK